MNLLSWAHLLTGTLAVVSGAVAMAAPKGRPLHRLGGRIFVPTMVLMAFSGTTMAALKPMPIAIVAGLFTLYLVLSAWLTVRMTDHQTWWNRLLAMGAAAIALGSAAMGWHSQDEYREPFFVFSTVAGLAALLDLRALIQSPARGRHRLARHLWRMCLAMLIAVGSLFTGPGAVVFPATWRDSPWMSLPEGLTLLLMLGWLIALAWAGWRQGKHQPVPPGPQNSARP